MPSRSDESPSAGRRGIRARHVLGTPACRRTGTSSSTAPCLPVRQPPMRTTRSCRGARPRRRRRRMSSVMWFRVPSTSSSPHRPQFDSVLKYPSTSSCVGTGRPAVVPASAPPVNAVRATKALNWHDTRSAGQQSADQQGCGLSHRRAYHEAHRQDRRVEALPPGTPSGGSGSLRILVGAAPRRVPDRRKRDASAAVGHLDAAGFDRDVAAALVSRCSASHDPRRLG